MMIPVTLLIAGGFLLAYIWSVRNGQFEDTTTPAMRILPDDKPISTAAPDLETNKHTSP
jgi:cbb3-type cytochrome oxidase maturation protein